MEVQKTLYSLLDIAKALGLPESNIRYYRDKFPEFIATEGEGRRRRYKPESIEVFRAISEGFAQNRQPKDIYDSLVKSFTKFYDVERDWNEQQKKDEIMKPITVQEEMVKEMTQVAGMVGEYMGKMQDTMLVMREAMDTYKAQAEFDREYFKREVETLRRELQTQIDLKAQEGGGEGEPQERKMRESKWAKVKNAWAKVFEKAE